MHLFVYRLVNFDPTINDWQIPYSHGDWFEYKLYAYIHSNSKPDRKAARIFIKGSNCSWTERQFYHYYDKITKDGHIPNHKRTECYHKQKHRQCQQRNQVVNFNNYC